MKRKVAVLLICVLLLSLIGCGASGSTETVETIGVMTMEIPEGWEKYEKDKNTLGLGEYVEDYFAYLGDNETLIVTLGNSQGLTLAQAAGMVEDMETMTSEAGYELIENGYDSTGEYTYYFSKYYASSGDIYNKEVVFVYNSKIYDIQLYAMDEVALDDYSEELLSSISFLE